MQPKDSEIKAKRVITEEQNPWHRLLSQLDPGGEDMCTTRNEVNLG